MMTKYKIGKYTFLILFEDGEFFVRTKEKGSPYFNLQDTNKYGESIACKTYVQALKLTLEWLSLQTYMGEKIEE